MKVTLAVIAVIIICMLEVPSLWKNNQRRELVVFAAFIIPESVLLICIAMNINLHSPIEIVEIVVQKGISTFLSII